MIFLHHFLRFQMLPVHVAKVLRAGQKVDPETYPDVTLLFSDIVGFTDISAASNPENVFRMLDNLYTALDEELTCNFPKLFKVETIGDAYMVVANLGEPEHDLNTTFNKFKAPCSDHVDKWFSVLTST